MSLEQLEKRRIQLEISKLEAETEKLLIETKALKKPLIFRPSALIPVLVGIVTLMGSGLQLYKTDQELTKSTQSNQGLESYNKGLQTQLEKQHDDTPKVDENESIIPKLPTRVSIQFRGDINRELITAFQEQFNNLGMPAPRPERIASEYENSIRYFHGADSNISADVQRITEEFFREHNCPININSKLMTGFEDKVKKGVIEVWIHHVCQ